MNPRILAAHAVSLAALVPVVAIVALVVGAGACDGGFSLNPADYARYIMTVLEGMSVQAAGGASREDLHKVADMTMRSWPAA